MQNVATAHWLGRREYFINENMKWKPTNFLTFGSGFLRFHEKLLLSELVIKTVVVTTLLDVGSLLIWTATKSKNNLFCNIPRTGAEELPGNCLSVRSGMAATPGATSTPHLPPPVSVWSRGWMAQQGRSRRSHRGPATLLLYTTQQAFTSELFCILTSS